MSQNTPESRFPKMMELKTDVLRHCVSTDGDEESSFLPRDKLEELTTGDRVKKALNETGISKEKLKDLLDFVAAGGARRVFLILVLMSSATEEHLSKLETLKENGVKDDSLPLAFTTPATGETCCGYPCESGADKELYSVFNDWSVTHRELFEKYQWCLTAPVFDGAKFRYQIHPRRILPYLTVATHPASNRFFGEVSRVEIHPAHIPAFKTNPTPETKGFAIAIKKVRASEDSANAFDKETEELQIYPSRYLIRPIAAYQIDSDRYLMFPRADASSLRDYWASHDNHRQDPTHLKWIVDQFAGICGALTILHTDNCSHGNLSPENILWFKSDNDMGNLGIADLGLTKFHEEEATTKQQNWDKIHTLTPPTTFRYSPPEMNENRDDKKSQSRQYDVWSMGCTIVELLVWLVHGFESVEKFRNATKYFWTELPESSASAQKYALDSHVTLCLDAMEKSFSDGTAHKDLLSLVRTRLLVTPVSDNDISSSEYREIACGLSTAMNEIQKRCRTEDSYLRPIDAPYPSPPDMEKANAEWSKPSEMTTLRQST
ncbi:hypothetical protein QQS21_002933 [Conoideocrella luteorostrata]|uniref:Protein kinase domain-containing protein n=1 Tax=Conoideocrella luteorostrata TaxID=1105319 RepID=A0AAJ0G2N4_9HYPO|nr:hypothetical protein QQS21_002933 [Conoideocrella luteorostrata]